MGRLFVTKRFDMPIYFLLQHLRVAHGDASQWEILQAALVAFARVPPQDREAALAQVRRAPSEQPSTYEIAK